jgi:hypothetical protein
MQIGQKKKKMAKTIFSLAVLCGLFYPAHAGPQMYKSHKTFEVDETSCHQYKQEYHCNQNDSCKWLQKASQCEERNPSPFSQSARLKKTPKASHNVFTHATNKAIHNDGNTEQLSNNYFIKRAIVEPKKKLFFPQVLLSSEDEQQILETDEGPVFRAVSHKATQARQRARLAVSSEDLETSEEDNEGLPFVEKKAIPPRTSSSNSHWSNELNEEDENGEQSIFSVKLDDLRASTSNSNKFGGVYGTLIPVVPPVKPPTTQKSVNFEENDENNNNEKNVSQGWFDFLKVFPNKKLNSTNPTGATNSTTRIGVILNPVRGYEEDNDEINEEKSVKKIGKKNNKNKKNGKKSQKKIVPNTTTNDNIEEASVAKARSFSTNNAHGFEEDSQDNEEQGIFDWFKVKKGTPTASNSTPRQGGGSYGTLNPVRTASDEDDSINDDVDGEVTAQSYGQKSNIIGQAWDWLFPKATPYSSAAGPFKPRKSELLDEDIQNDLFSEQSLRQSPQILKISPKLSAIRSAYLDEDDEYDEYEQQNDKHAGLSGSRQKSGTSHGIASEDADDDADNSEQIYYVNASHPRQMARVHVAEEDQDIVEFRQKKKISNYMNNKGRYRNKLANIAKPTVNMVSNVHMFDEDEEDYDEQGLVLTPAVYKGRSKNNVLKIGTSKSTIGSGRIIPL